MIHPSEACGARHWWPKLQSGELCACGQQVWVILGDGSGWAMPNPSYSAIVKPSWHGTFPVKDEKGNVIGFGEQWGD